MVFGQTLVLLLNKVKKQGSARTVLKPDNREGGSLFRYKRHPCYIKMSATINEQIVEYFLNGILELIENSPIAKIMYNEYIKIKICQRLSLGWDEIHRDPHLSEKSRTNGSSFSYKNNQMLLSFYDMIFPQQIKQLLLSVFDQYSPQNGNVSQVLKDHLGFRYYQELFSSDKDEDEDGDEDEDEDVHEAFKDLDHEFQDKINNGAKTAPAA